MQIPTLLCHMDRDFCILPFISTEEFLLDGSRKGLAEFFRLLLELTGWTHTAPFPVLAELPPLAVTTVSLVSKPRWFPFWIRAAEFSKWKLQLLPSAPDSTSCKKTRENHGIKISPYLFRPCQDKQKTWIKQYAAVEKTTSRVEPFTVDKLKNTGLNLKKRSLDNLSTFCQSTL